MYVYVCRVHHARTFQTVFLIFYFFLLNSTVIDCLFFREYNMLYRKFQPGYEILNLFFFYTVSSNQLPLL